MHQNAQLHQFFRLGRMRSRNSNLPEALGISMGELPKPISCCLGKKTHTHKKINKDGETVEASSHLETKT